MCVFLPLQADLRFQMETKKLCSRQTRKGNLTCKFTVTVLVLPAAALMTVGFWQAQPGLVYRQCVAVLLPESRAAILMRSHLHAEVVEVQHATCRRLHVDIPARCGRHFDEVTSACKSCWKYNMTFARVNRWTSINLKNSPRVLQKNSHQPKVATSTESPRTPCLNVANHRFSMAGARMAVFFEGSAKHCCHTTLKLGSRGV